MFTASDRDLMNAIFAQGDSKDPLIYGLINAIDDPDQPTKSKEKRKLPKTDTLAYAAFTQAAPCGFLPELRSIDTSPFDASAAMPARNKPHRSMWLG